jgi:hypothetical protein
MNSELTKRSQYLIRWGALVQERSSWFGHWKEISDFVLPRSGRFFVSDRNKGQKRHNNIIDETATRALRVLAAGMMAGMTSPARAWFRLATPDSDLMEFAPVKEWLDIVTKKMRDVFAGSNTYRALHTMYEELGAFGTGANLILPNFNTVVHNTPQTIGEYCIGVDNEGNVNTLARQFEMQVGAMVQEFGEENLSLTVRNLYRGGTGFDKWVPIIHIIEPRMARDYTKRDNLNMPFKSCYFEQGGNEDKFLRESGFKRFPALCPRWATSGGDIYGNSPGMEMLGSVKQLQHDQLRKSQAIDYQVKPPLGLPTALKDQPSATLPGGHAYYDMTGPNTKIHSMFDVRLDLNAALADIQDIRSRINSTCYADLFLMLAQQTGDPRMTAREVAERHEEKLLMLGPVLERLENEFLKPLVDITFDEMIRARIVPPPPPELQGQDLNIRFVGMLAQAQRAVGTQSVDRLIGMIGSIAVLQANSGVAPTALDKLDTDQSIDAYSDMLGTDPNLIVADDQVVLIRQNRAEQQAAAQKAAMAPAAADTAKTMSETDTSGKNALTDVMGQFSGYAVPGAL